MKKILVIFAALMILSSCSLLMLADMTSSHSELTERAYLHLEIFQTLNENAALARTEDYKVVQIKSYEEVLYDGKTFQESFILIDTYTYETKDETTKTVPVYMKLSEYNRIMKR